MVPTTMPLKFLLWGAQYGKGSGGTLNSLGCYMLPQVSHKQVGCGVNSPWSAMSLESGGGWKCCATQCIQPFGLQVGRYVNQ